MEDNNSVETKDAWNKRKDNMIDDRVYSTDDPFIYTMSRRNFVYDFIMPTFDKISKEKDTYILQLKESAARSVIKTLWADIDGKRDIIRAITKEKKL